MLIKVAALLLATGTLAGSGAQARLWDEHLTPLSEREPAPGPGGISVGDRYTKRQRAEISAGLARTLTHGIRVATYNILFNFTDDQFEDKHKWPQRLPRVTEILKTIDADIVGVQESQCDQIEDLKKAIGDTYEIRTVQPALTKVDRDSKFADAILLRRGRFEVLEEAFDYHSPTRDRPSLAAEASFATVDHRLVLKDRRSGARFALVNVHHYYFSAEVREQAIHGLARYRAAHPDLPLILVGDLNLQAPHLEREPKFLDGHHMLRDLKRAGLEDAYDMALLGHLGPLSTYTVSPDAPRQVFSGRGLAGLRLDRVFASREVTILLHGIYDMVFTEGYASDHFPVVVDLTL